MAKVIAKNKFARFNYELLKIYQGGIVLTGAEIKSIRAGNVNIRNCYLTMKDGEIWIINMHISNYMKIEADEQRTRKVLLHKREILKIKMLLEAKRLALVATTLIFARKGIVKIEFAIAKGKSMSDKREVIKKRDTDRALRAKLKNTP